MSLYVRTNNNNNMDKENLRLGRVTGLKASEEKILKALLGAEKTYFTLKVKDLRLFTGLSESAVTKAVCFLKERGIVSGSKGFAKIAGKIIVKKLQGED